ncbi:hypothetical protein M9H77_23019 [Catharanthus roseus]|uniref:Uncharacterized protein n=1 Tax=Catharanthus roseus TaxID=4058 RepID=A0ACC0AST0_CATRO|nr:hypothetical protein M9H77_23019 [Catharanthus roseus]
MINTCFCAGANTDHDLLLVVFLPALLFESSFSIEVHQIKILRAQSAAKAKGYSDVLYIDCVQKKYLEAKVNKNEEGEGALLGVVWSSSGIVAAIEEYFDKAAAAGEQLSEMLETGRGQLDRSFSKLKRGQSSSLFNARYFECNSTDHLVADCPKAIEKEKGALEAKLEALKKKKKGKGLIGTWDQDSSESEGEEKTNICFMALENKVQSSPSNSSNLIDNICEDDPCTMLIEMYGECEKVSKRNKELKNKNQFLLDENSKLICENKSLLESLEILKNEKECTNNDFQNLY